MTNYVAVGSGQTYVVSAGQKDNFDSVESGGLLINSGTIELTGDGGEILDDGFAGGTSVGSGGVLWVYGAAGVGVNGPPVLPGTPPTLTQIDNGGVEIVFAGGSDASTVVSSGGTLALSGGEGIDEVVDSGGQLGVFSGGLASATTISSGGEEFVFSDGVASSATVDGGLLDVSSGGTASSVTLSNGTVVQPSYLIIESGGAVSGPLTFAGYDAVFQIDSPIMPTNVISGFGITDVLDLAGIAYTSNTSVNLLGGNVVQVTSGVNNFDLRLDPSYSYTNTFFVETDLDGGTAVFVGLHSVVAANTTASGLTLSFGSTQDVSGTANNITVMSGGAQYVFPGGRTSGTTLSGGAEQIVESNGSATSTTVDSGGYLAVINGGTAVGTVVGSGGEVFVGSGGVASNVLLEGGSALIAGGTVELGSGSTGDLIGFELSSGASTGSGEVIFAEPIAYTGVISGLESRDILDLAHTSATSATISGTTLTVTETNNQLLTFQVADPEPDLHLRIQSDGSGGTNLIAVYEPPPEDFTGSGASDVLWLNSSGEVDTWLMTNGQMVGGSVLGTQSSAWRFAGSGDILGNDGGVSDVVWQNTSTGEVESWLISNDQVDGGAAIGHASSVWQPLGTGDFNGDGTSDLLWRNTTTGEVDTWLMNNGQVSGGTAVGSVSNAWQFAGIGDFTGTGTSDVLWHNAATGEVDTWLINNGHLAGGTAIGHASSAWQALGIGDFTGDGTSDILWRNTATGEVDTWLMNNGQVTGGTALGSVSSAWQFAGIGDYTGSGTSDILWRNNSTGEVDTWLITNDRLTGGTAISTASTAWQPQVIHTG
jgi:autotransporter passenger strand-loop-strand repeat protein